MNIKYANISDDMNPLERLLECLECAKHNLDEHSSIKILHGTPLGAALEKQAYLSQAEANVSHALLYARDEKLLEQVRKIFEKAMEP